MKHRFVTTLCVCGLSLVGCFPGTLRPTGYRRAPTNVSGLALVGEQMWLVDDDEGVFAANDGALLAGRREDGQLDDLEGISADGRGGAYVVAEETGQILHVVFDDNDEVQVERVGDDLQGQNIEWAPEPNKGFEGIAYLPAEFSGDDRLLLVNEDQPKAVVVANMNGVWLETLALSEAADEALADLSDIAVNPTDGRIWLLSDESETIVVGVLATDEFLAIDTFAPPDVLDGSKPEAITFASDGSLWLGTDADSELIHYQVRP
jgi:uncharacterized protein YjiK